MTLPRVFYTILLFACVTAPALADVQNSPGKVIVVIEQSLRANGAVSSKIDQFENDLIGDGWRVLETVVQPGPVNGSTGWAAANAPLVRQVKALIQADYKSDPNQVKAVLLLGHVPIPFAGDATGVVGGHDTAMGAHPADWFYADQTTPYGPTGWSDYSTDTSMDVHGPCEGWPNSGTIINTPGDGKFDNGFWPGNGTPELAIGRIDLSDMDAFQNRLNGLPPLAEADLMVQYFNKNHDFRTASANMTVTRKALLAHLSNGIFTRFDSSVLGQTFAVSDVTDDSNTHWFHSFNGPTSFLLGYGGGWGNVGPNSQSVANDGDIAGVGATSRLTFLSEAGNNFVDVDSRAVFVSFFGSYVGDWSAKNSLLKAPLANPYSPPANNGCGLATWWGGYSILSYSPSLDILNAGGTIGDALKKAWSEDVHDCDVGRNSSISLMGDPTLRFDSVPSVQNLRSSNMVLSWFSTGSPSSFRVYSAPTKKGPFVFKAETTSTSISRTWSTDPNLPDNYFMVRAVTTQSLPPSSKSYLNLSEGVVVAATTGAPSTYCAIQSDPKAFSVDLNANDSPYACASFAVEAYGVDSARNENLTYQWMCGTQILSDSDPQSPIYPHYQGTHSRCLLITGIKAGNDADYKVVVTSGSNQRTSAVAHLTVRPISTANPDSSYSMLRGDTLYMSVLANDQKASPNSQLSLYKCTVVLNGGKSPGTPSLINNNTQIRFQADPAFIGSAVINYILQDKMPDGSVGYSATRATITVDKRSSSPPTISFPPGFSGISVPVGNTRPVPVTLSDDQPGAIVVSAVADNDHLSILPPITSPPITSSPTILPSDIQNNLSGLIGELSPPGTCLAQDLVYYKFSSDVRAKVNSGLATAEDLAGALNSAITCGVVLSHDGLDLKPITQQLIERNNLNQLSGVALNWLDYLIILDGLGITPKPSNFSVTGAGSATVFNIHAGAATPGSATLIVRCLDQDNNCSLFQIPVTVTAISANQPPVTYFPSKQVAMQEDTSYDIAFTLSDDNTLPDYIQISAEYSSTSSPNLIANRDISITGSGSNRVLHIQPGLHQFGSGTIMVTFLDENGSHSTQTLSVSVIVPNRPTLAAQSFTQDGFQFTLNGPPGQSVQIFASQDLVNWSALVTTSFSPFGIVGYSDYVGSASRRFYRASTATGTSQIIGFSKIALRKGVPLAFSDPFKYSNDNFLREILTSMPESTSLQLYKGGAFLTASYYVGDGWDNGEFQLLPGSGATVTATEDCSVTLMGDVETGTLLNTIPAFETQCSSRNPVAGTLSELGLLAANGTQLRKWDNSAAGWGSPLTYQSGQWYDGQNPVSPVFAFGECFVISNAQSITWSQTYNPPIPLMPPSLQSPGFDGATFRFDIAGVPTGSQCTVFASPDMVAWCPVGPITAPVRYSDVSASSYTRRFYRVQYGNSFSGVVGFARVTVAAGQTALLSNPFQHTPNSSVAEVLTGVPISSVVSKWVAGQWQIDALYDNSTPLDPTAPPTWDDPDITLNPGEGFVFQAPSGVSAVLTFSGNVIQGQLASEIPQNLSMVASLVPAAGNINELGINLFDNDIVEKWNPAKSGYDIYQFRTAQGWMDATEAPVESPKFDYCESFFVNSPQNRTWMQNSFQPCSPQPQLTSVAYNSFTISGVPNGAVCVISDSDNGVNWNTLAKVTVSGCYTYTDPSAVSLSRRFYRVSFGDGLSKILGFTRTVVPANKSVLFANLFDHSPDNTVTTLFGAAPPMGVFKWSGTSWICNGLYDDHTWDDPSMELDRGDAFMINPGSEVTIVLFGSVSTGHFDHLVPHQLSLHTSLAFQLGRPDQWGFQFADGDVIYKWNVDKQNYDQYTYSSAKWLDSISHPADFKLNIGEPFFIDKGPRDTVSWGEDYFPPTP